MRRIVSPTLIIPLMLASLLAINTTVTHADGLYVGHGRRSHDHDWSVRINGAAGLHGAFDGFDRLNDFGQQRHPFGGYAHGGLEFAVGNDNSLEIFGLYRELDDTDRFRVLAFNGTTDFVFRQDEVKAWSIGGTLRHYMPSSRRSAGYFGVGAGYVHAESVHFEAVEGVPVFDFQSEDDAGEIHAVLGWDGRLGRNLTAGVEIGYRHGWLSDPNDFSGLLLGVRLGVLVGP